MASFSSTMAATLRRSCQGVACLSVRARMAPPQSWPRAWQAPMMPATFRTFSAQARAKPEVKVFYENDTHTVCSVVRDPNSQKAAIIDSVLGFNYYSGSTDSTHADLVADYIKSNNLEVEWILETHAHADHLSAAPYLQGKLGGKIAIGEHIREVQHVFAGIFNLGHRFKQDGSQFDKLFADGETFNIGSLEASVMHTPGHTPACICYHIGDALFTGHTIFMPDYGSARCDFPGGSARTLYSSIQRRPPGFSRCCARHGGDDDA
eukprot:s2667_g2.t1